MNSVGMILFTLIAFFSGLRTEVGSSANTGVAGNKYIYKTGNSTNNDVINSDFFSANTVFACDVPSGVGTGQVNIGSATINFLSAGNNFIVEYGLPGFTPGIDANPGTGGTVVTGIASPIVITGLTGSTAYDVYVRQVCAGPVYSANSSVIQFTTLCPAANVPYAENFDGVTAPAIPSCMLVENANGGNTWRTVGNDFAASSPNIMRVDYETDGTTPANDWFFLHGLNLTGGTSYRLTFKYRNSDATTWVEKMEVKYGTAANAASMTAGTLFSNTNIDFNTWATVDADFTPASSGVYYIGFHGFSDADQAFLCVDDVSVDVTPTCFPPTGLNVTSVTLTSADINWTAASPVPGVGYDLYYSTSSTAPVSGTTPSFAGITGLTQALSGLTHSTTYYVWLRSDCGAGNKSTWTALPTFNTLLINDDAPGAITLTVGAGCTGAIYTNVGATAGTGEVYPSCSGTIQVPVWFKFVAPASGAVRISTDLGTGNTFTDSKVGLFSATNVNDYATFGILSCDDDGGSALGSGFLSVVYATGLTAGNTYYIAVDKSTSSTTNGTFCIAVDELDASMLATANTCGSAYQSPFGSNTTYTGWVPLLDGSSRLVAMVKNPSGGSVSSYSVAQNINAAAVRTDVTSGQRYLDRNFRINNSGSATNVNVQFFFLNSELTALQAADAGVTLANLGVTHQTGSTCQDDFTAANGINSFLAQTVNGTSTDGLVKWIQVQTPSFSNFYLHTSKTPVTLKAFLQGAYNATLSRHNDVTAQWVNVLNAGSFPSGALTQPYSSFGHTGSESVSPGFFTVTGGSDDIVDWVLLELRSAPPPAAPVATRAAFIREDGMIVDLDKVSSVSFRGVANGNYYVTIRHRNHLGIRTSALQLLDGALGSNPAPGVYDFTTALNRAYKDVTISTNEAMAVNGAVYLMWAGNANQDNYVRVTSSAIPVIPSDAATILTILGGTPNGTGTVYSAGDINMDGRTRVTSSAIPVIPSDVSFILGTPLSGNNNGTRREHK